MRKGVLGGAAGGPKRCKSVLRNNKCITPTPSSTNLKIKTDTDW